MQVRNRYGGTQNLPDRVALALIKAGTVRALESPRTEEVREQKRQTVAPKKAK